MLKVDHGPKQLGIVFQFFLRLPAPMGRSPNNEPSSVAKLLGRITEAHENSDDASQTRSV